MSNLPIIFGADGGDTQINDLCYDDMYYYLAVGSSQAPPVISASWTQISAHASLLSGTSHIPIAIQYEEMSYSIDKVYTSQINGADYATIAANDP